MIALRQPQCKLCSNLASGDNGLCTACEAQMAARILHQHQQHKRWKWNSVDGKIRCKYCHNGYVDFRVWTGWAWRDIPSRCKVCEGSGWVWPLDEDEDQE